MLGLRLCASILPQFESFNIRLELPCAPGYTPTFTIYSEEICAGDPILITQTPPTANGSSSGCTAIPQKNPGGPRIVSPLFGGVLDYGAKSVDLTCKPNA